MQQESSRILTVSRLAGLLKDTVEENFVQVLVEGEISNFAAPASGHLYFSLKDEKAQIRVVVFRSEARLLRFRPENGIKVICSGRVSVYPQRGEVQLIAESIDVSGAGALQVAFEQLKERLAAEGLFDQERKRSLPPFPRTIGVVTSATGAAIHDIRNVLLRRGAGVRILLHPVRVQGEGAAGEIAEAISNFNRHGEADVLIVGRGGGSLEDLWAFNEEVVARAVRGSKIPVISAVGHEVDFTIADFVADLRAPTPSAAAEMVLKSRFELESHLDHLLLRLTGQMKGRLELLRSRLDGLQRRLRSPQQELALRRQRLQSFEEYLQRAMHQGLGQLESRVASLCGRLDALSPLRTLARGYAIVFKEETKEVVRDGAETAVDERLRIRFRRGEVMARVEEVGE